MNSNYNPKAKTRRYSSDSGVFVSNPPVVPHKQDSVVMGRKIGLKNKFNATAQAQGKRILAKKGANPMEHPVRGSIKNPSKFGLNSSVKAPNSSQKSNGYQSDYHKNLVGAFKDNGFKSNYHKNTTGKSKSNGYDTDYHTQSQAKKKVKTNGYKAKYV